MPDRPKLRINGATYPQWESVSVSMSLETVPDVFTMEATAARTDIPAGAVCEVLWGNDPVLKGRVEKPSWHAGRDGRSFSVSGRSLPGDLVDCSAKPGTYLNANLATFGDQLADPYGATVRCASGVTSPVIPRIVVRPGESVYSVLEKQARSQAMLWTCAADGALVLTVPGTESRRTILAFPYVESMDLAIDMTRRFDTIECRGHTAGGTSGWGLDSFAVSSVSDDSLKGTRKLILNAPNTATAQQCLDRAAIEMAARYGKSVNLTVTTSDWRDADGVLWRPGCLVPCRDEWTGLDSRLILRSVELTYSATGGTTATLGLTVPQAYQWSRIQAKDPKLASGLRSIWPELLGDW